MDYIVRTARLEDKNKLFALYKQVSQYIGGIAREQDEITQTYIENNLQKSLKTGIILVVENPQQTQELIAEIHCYQLEPKVFNHVLSELTVVVHPGFQGIGIGKLIFEQLLHTVEMQRTDILRVELIARESNGRAIAFYQKLAFNIEGRFERRIKNKNGQFEADIPMAWFNKNFKQ